MAMNTFKKNRLLPVSSKHVSFTTDSVCMPNLTRLGSNLGRSTLGALLALDPASLATSGSHLRLLSLLLLLGLVLLLLSFLDGGLAGGETGLGAHVSAFLDHIHGGANDTALVLDGATGALLGNFL